MSRRRGSFGIGKGQRKLASDPLLLIAGLALVAIFPGIVEPIMGIWRQVGLPSLPAINGVAAVIVAVIWLLIRKI